MNIVYSCLKLLNYIIPKSNDEVVFVNSMSYADNISALLECYMVAHNRKEFRRISVISNYNISFAGVLPSNVHELKSYMGMWRLFSAKYIICDSSILPTIMSNRQNIINVWHGLGLKKILGYCEYPKCFNYYYATYAMAYSDFFSSVTQKAFGVSCDRVIVSGAPRVDYFRFTDKKILLKINKKADKYLKTIIWMPTYRQSETAYSKNDGHDYSFGIPLLTVDNVDELNECLLKNNILLIIKYHSLQNKQESLRNLYSNITILTSYDVTKTNEALYRFVGVCDALITDYSSIYLEYLVLNRPICFAYDDMDEYIKKRGFMFKNVLSIMPGNHAQNMHCLLDFINDMGKDKDEHIEERELCVNKMGLKRDYKNSERFLRKIGFIGNE